ncbi:MAG: hypothetical protein EHM72_20870, partial [Calditrichaeota bacterium]
MNHQTKRCLIYSALYLLVLPAFAGSAQAAECREPMYGTALVDGDYGEWNLNTDFFVDMHHAWNKPTVLSKLYLRYDCAANVMYVLVLTTNHDRTMETTAEEAWIIIDGGKAVDDTYQSFKWIDKMSNMAVGWEASFILDPGNHVIKAHSNVWWDNESQTSGTSDISL